MNSWFVRSLKNWYFPYHLHRWSDIDHQYSKTLLTIIHHLIVSARTTAKQIYLPKSHAPSKCSQSIAARPIIITSTFVNYYRLEGNYAPNWVVVTFFCSCSPLKLTWVKGHQLNGPRTVATMTNICVWFYFYCTKVATELIVAGQKGLFIRSYYLRKLIAGLPWWR